ncbi:hypothetical protein AZ20_4210 [Bordetella bronchiseptica E014]|uniref:hypothetical protein n=1 Tax=Bordetella bronchiseptica TaxID=518 RepID=UPI000460A5B1|nr:hypothetical protein [Bordetella bronchiseptica]KDC23037.1 hypothetical protein AZ20_4210 [Bordetella bronchiseptica E014]KDC59268.1 hypothetical protein L511_4132 [Bordetella bronchiseptica MBORD595]KDC66499.1 hypothetical protein L512_5240 [Bordetella bronchiseptica MBORD624]
MATVFTDTPKIGVALLQKIDSADTKQRSGHRLGSQVWGSDGKRYVYAQAGGAIAASTAAASVNATTFIATGSGGSYTSPPVAMAAGDQGWFAATSV